MYRLDLHGRVVGGLLEACGATNPLFKHQRLEVLHAQAALAGGNKHQLINSSNAPLVGLGQGTFPETQASSQTTNGEEGEVVPGKKRKGRKAAAAAQSAAAPAADQGNGDAPIGGTSSRSGNLVPHVSSSSATPAQSEETARTGKKSKNTELYCVCKSPWDAQRFMIGCVGPCEGWFHPECLGYVTTGKKDVFLQDADGVKFDVQNSFYCPWCELASGASGPSETNEKKAATFSSRISKWCDIADLGDENVATDDNESPFVTRWRILLQARNSIEKLPQCRSCEKSHHPLFTCPITSSTLSITSHKRGSSPRLGEQNCPEEANPLLPIKLAPPSGELFALVVGGKYQSLKGKVTGTSKKWSQLELDLDKTSIITVPNHFLLFSKEKDFSSPSDAASGERSSWESEAVGMFGNEFFGVVPAATGGGFIAYYDLDDSYRIYLGRYSSRIRAARAFDMAAKLQCGDNEQVHGNGVGLLQLNFPDRGRLVPPKTSSPSLMDKAIQLAHTISLGPFPSSGASVTSNIDALHVLAWCENQLSELEEVPPYFPICTQICESLLESVVANAELIATKLGNTWRFSVPVSTQGNKTREHADASAVADVEEDDELDVIVKKFIRTRSAKPKRSMPM